jgi:hypothetical protein
MSGVTNVGNTNFTDISSKTTERLIHNHPMSNNQGKSVSKLKNLDDSYLRIRKKFVVE